MNIRRTFSNAPWSRCVFCLAFRDGFCVFGLCSVLCMVQSTYENIYRVDDEYATHAAVCSIYIFCVHNNLDMANGDATKSHQMGYRMPQHTTRRINQTVGETNECGVCEREREPVSDKWQSPRIFEYIFCLISDRNRINARRSRINERITRFEMPNRRSLLDCCACLFVFVTATNDFTSSKCRAVCDLVTNRPECSPRAYCAFKAQSDIHSALAVLLLERMSRRFKCKGYRKTLSILAPGPGQWVISLINPIFAKKMRLITHVNGTRMQCVKWSSLNGEW